MTSASVGLDHVALSNVNGLTHSTNEVIGCRDIVAYSTVHRSWQQPFMFKTNGVFLVLSSIVL